MVTLIGEPSQLEPGIVEQLLGGLADRPGRLTVIAVARRPMLWPWAPLSGLATAAAIEEGALSDAEQAARTTAMSVPRDLSVRYESARSWKDAMDRASDDGIVLLAGRPRGWRTRRRHRATNQQGERHGRR